MGVWGIVIKGGYGGCRSPQATAPPIKLRGEPSPQATSPNKIEGTCPLTPLLDAILETSKQQANTMSKTCTKAVATKVTVTATKKEVPTSVSTSASASARGPAPVRVMSQADQKFVTAVKAKCELDATVVALLIDLAHQAYGNTTVTGKMMSGWNAYLKSRRRARPPARFSTPSPSGTRGKGQVMPRRKSGSRRVTSSRVAPVDRIWSQAKWLESVHEDRDGQV